jgi:hypothetical protein
MEIRPLSVWGVRYPKDFSNYIFGPDFVGLFELDSWVITASFNQIIRLHSEPANDFMISKPDEVYTSILQRMDVSRTYEFGIFRHRRMHHRPDTEGTEQAVNISVQKLDQP